MFDAHCHAAPEPPPAAGPAPAEAAAGRLLCGVGPGDWGGVAAAAAAWPGTIAAYGLHPWRVGEAGEGWPAELENRLAADPAAWLGEAGLDGISLSLSTMEAQLEAFRRQMRLAARLGRAVNLHCVKAWDELLGILDAEYLAGGQPRPFILHSFGGPHQFIRPLAERGAYFTVGPLFSRRDSPRHRARVALLPAERLLLESDAFVPPGRDAVPDLEHALDWLARARDMDAGALAEQVGANAGRLFGL